MAVSTSYNVSRTIEPTKIIVSIKSSTTEETSIFSENEDLIKAIIIVLLSVCCLIIIITLLQRNKMLCKTSWKSKADRAQLIMDEEETSHTTPDNAKAS